MPFLEESHNLLMKSSSQYTYTRAQSPDTLLRCLSTGLGSLFTRLSIILTKYFHIIDARAQSPDIGSGACQYNMQGKMPFLTEPGSVYESLFALYIHGLRALTFALIPDNIIYRVVCPFY